MIDASNGFLKDGNKNRLRSRDIHQIVDAYSKGVAVAGYARSVSFEEIEKNDFNLNLPRYIDNRAAEDIQDIAAHLEGGIPQRDVDALQKYWVVCPNLRASLFKPLREGYVALTNDEGRMANSGANNPSSAISPSQSIQAHPDFVNFTKQLETHFEVWSARQSLDLKRLCLGFNPKDFIHGFSEGLFAHYHGQPLIDPYAVYQHLMDYWSETLQDDTYQIAIDGWVAKTSRILETKKGAKGKPDKTIDRGWTCDLVPKELIIARYFAKEQAALDTQVTKLESLTAQHTELEEEHSSEDGAFAELDKINKANITTRLKELKAERPGNAFRAKRQDRAQSEPEHLPIRTTSPKPDPESRMVAEDPATYNQPKTAELSEFEVLQQWLQINKDESTLKKDIKTAEAHLDTLAHDQYPQLSPSEIQTLVVDDKWLATLQQRTHSELDRITQGLTQRVKQLAERYDAPLASLTLRTADLESKVSGHLKRMGFVAAQIDNG